MGLWLGFRLNWGLNCVNFTVVFGVNHKSRLSVRTRSMIRVSTVILALSVHHIPKVYKLVKFKFFISNANNSN